MMMLLLLLLLFSANAKKDKQIVAEGGQARAYECDVTNRTLVYSLGKTIRTDFGKVDILINNAGLVSGKKFLENRYNQK